MARGVKGKPWLESIRKTRRLGVYLDPGLAAGRWHAVVRPTVTEFDALLKSKGIRLRFEISADRPKDGGGADVAVQAADGAFAVPYAGATISGKLAGRILHGQTSQVSRAGADPRIEKAFVFLPKRPQISTDKGPRDAGPGVLKVILAHELVHACGLSNGDHSTDDLFNGYPSADYGQTPDQDRVLVQVHGRTHRMPPLLLGAGTVAKLKALW